MDEWFKEPIFHGDIDSHFKQMHEHMNQMIGSMMKGFEDIHKQFGLSFDPEASRRPALEDSSRRGDSYGRPKVEETSGSSFGRSAQKPIVEEPDSFRSGRSNGFGSSDRFGTSNRSGTLDRYGSSGKSDRFGDSSNFGASGKPRTFIYQAAMETFGGPDGCTHKKMKKWDSESGKTEMQEERRLGDQALTMKREIDRDGHVKDDLTRHNVNESDVDSFRKRWDESYGKRREMYKNMLGSTQPRYDSTRALK